MTSKTSFFPGKKRLPWETGLDMGNQTIFNVKDATVADYGVNKKYVDAETSKNTTKFNQLTTSTNAKFATAQNE